MYICDSKCSALWLSRWTTTKIFLLLQCTRCEARKKTNFVQKNEDCIMKTLHYINFGLSVSMSIDDALYTTNCVVYICIKLNRESFDLIHLYTITVQHTPKRWQFFFTFCFFILAAACFRCLVFSLFVVFSFKFFFLRFVFVRFRVYSILLLFSCLWLVSHWCSLCFTTIFWRTLVWLCRCCLACAFVCLVFFCSFKRAKFS